jgi:alpha-glucosidase
MKILTTEVITDEGLHISMPVSGVVRVTDGGNKKSYAVSAKLRKRKFKLVGGRVCWGKIGVEPDNGMALYYDGVLLCMDHVGKKLHAGPLSAEELETLKGEGHLSDEDVRRLSAQWPIEVFKQLGNNDAIYGLGDKPGFLNKRHYAYENWNTDDPKPHCDNYRSLYKSIPFFIIATDGGFCGILADNTYRTRFDFGKECEDYLYWSHANGSLDYYMIPGKNLKQVLRGYYALTGKNELQQKWAYGFHQSRWSYDFQDEILQLVKDYRELRLPLDVVHMDIDYMDGYRVFTFDKERFSDVAEMNRLLAKQGVRTVSIVDPGVKLEQGYFVYEEGLKNEYFAKNADGTVYEGKVWPGAAVFPDFSREDVRDWWGDKLNILIGAGISGIWNDMNEPANFTGQLPDDVQFADGDHLKMHNVYGHLMAQATYDGLKKHTEQRPFVLTRACYGGSQRYCSGWTGDNHSLWHHLQLSVTQMMNLGLSGMNFVGADVGGFGSDTTPELMIRWMQLGALSPFFRNHSAKGTKRQELNCFAARTIDAFRKALQLRYHLLPYIYDIAHEDLPIVRPMVMEYPNDPACRDLTDQYMLGDRLLVAPVMTPGVTARAVYLPKGVWYDYHTGKRYVGGKNILVDCPIDQIPLFAKGGAVIPVSEGCPQSSDEIERVYLEVFPGRGEWLHYTDDGASLAYQKGEYHCLKVTVRGRNVSQTVVHNGFAGNDILNFVII